MKVILLYEVENEHRIRGKLYQQITDLSCGIIKNERIDLFVVYNENCREYVQKSESGMYITINGEPNYNVWHII